MSQLGEQRFLKCLGIWFFLALGPQPNISTLSTLVFLLLQKCEFALYAMHCCVIRMWSSDFNPSSYLQLWISCVHQSSAAGASLGQELIGLSYLSAVDLIVRGLIAFKICHMASYGWAMVFEIVHLLKLLQLSKFDDRSQTMPRVTAIFQKHMNK